MIQARVQNRTTLKPIEGRLRTRCAKCETEFYIGPSLAMKSGVNSGHCTCPKCQTFLHVEILEGDEAWTEPFDEYLARKPK
jgi:hypothetical protein